MTSLDNTRANAAQTLLTNVQAILEKQNLDHDSLSQIREQLIELAGQSSLWSASNFPQSTGDTLHARYLVAQAGDMTLYLNVMRPGNKTPPHNHTTWACIAAVSGDEQNFLYERIDDASVPGKAELQQTAHITVAPGGGVALMPDDIHHVEITGDEAIRHLHLYGRPLETLDERLSFDMDAGTCKVMDIGVKTRSIASAGQEQ
jgi:predicted metal-dependent enzyme (double-stranded beta helix superfamily)